ncbi:MAG: PilZ domain-containing protein [Candidatus Omnitrophota bacterium]|nr:PilZ domain-containing protein [Candidatus Omnitrophota bacterium]
MDKAKQKTKNTRTTNTKDTDTLPIIEYRRFIRHPLSIPLTCKVIKKTLDEDKVDMPGVTNNISTGGLLFSTKHPIDVGSLITIKMPFEDKVFNVKSRVVHCAKSPEAKLYNIGASFYKPYDAFKVKLIEQIYLIAEYRDLRSIQLGREVSLEEASKEWIKRYSERFKRLYW